MDTCFRRACPRLEREYDEEDRDDEGGLTIVRLCCQPLEGDG